MAKTFYGTVTSNAADKTIVVTVNTSKTHPLYHKKYTVSKKFAAHDEKNEAQVGDKVFIAETRPISARKRFKLDRIEQKAAVKHVENETPLAEKPAEEAK
ncbi:MAG TPA: 30S ribosomal protein S17 [Candidatus Saccharimonadales bacterium]|nr:30S ribosomal protein S17 [Candidatus Saccharimonadales bacterium]